MTASAEYITALLLLAVVIIAVATIGAVKVVLVCIAGLLMGLALHYILTNDDEI